MRRYFPLPGVTARPRHPTGDSSGLIFTQPFSPQHSALRLMSKYSCARLFYFSPKPPLKHWGLAKRRRLGGFGFPVSTQCLLQPFHSHCAFRRWIQAACAQCGGEWDAAWEENCSQALCPQRMACRETNNISREISSP